MVQVDTDLTWETLTNPSLQFDLVKSDDTILTLQPVGYNVPLWSMKLQQKGMKICADGRLHSLHPVKNVGANHCLYVQFFVGRFPEMIYYELVQKVTFRQNFFAQRGSDACIIAGSKPDDTAFYYSFEDIFLMNRAIKNNEGLKVFVRTQLGTLSDNRIIAAQDMVTMFTEEEIGFLPSQKQ